MRRDCGAEHSRSLSAFGTWFLRANVAKRATEEAGRTDLFCDKANHMFCKANGAKSFLFNLCFENKRVRKIFGSGTMCKNVAPHAPSPPNFPHSEREAKVYPGCSSP